MSKVSTDQVAKVLGLDPATLSRYIKAGKISAPEPTMAGGMRMRLWTEDEVEHLRQILPKVANGRKTRWKKAREKQKGQAGVPVPHKKRKPKKK